MFLNHMPVRVGTPHQKKFSTKEDAINCINRHNGVTPVYVSLYNGSIVDKIAWDFDIDEEKEDAYDNWEECLEDFRILSERLEDEGYQQMSVLSGGGLHKYLKTKPEDLAHPRHAIRDVQEKYQQELNLKSDASIFGDFMRIMRVPNTYHIGAQRYCIPLEHDEIYYSPEELFDLASTQRWGIQAVTPGEPYPIRNHDKMGSRYTSHADAGAKVPGNFNPAEVEPEKVLFPIYPCIANILKNWRDMEKQGHGIGFRRRFLIILHLKEMGHTYEETVAVLKKYLSEEEFYHAVYDEEQVRQIYRRDDMLFPQCESLEKEIPCIHKEDNPCEMRNNLYV